MSVMVGHILQPAYTRRFAPETADGDLLPASVNSALVTGLLREKLGFNGLIITDSSAMAGISIALPREQLVPMTIAAGCDMFLFTRNLEEDLAFMEAGSCTLRGIGYSTASTISSLTGACLFRVVWLSTVFRAKPTLDMIYITYPLSWGLTAAASFILCVVLLRRMIRKKNRQQAPPEMAVKT